MCNLLAGAFRCEMRLEQLEQPTEANHQQQHPIYTLLENISKYNCYKIIILVFFKQNSS